MRFSKKEKFIAAWTSPILATVLIGAIASPIVIANNKKKSETISNSESFTPTSFSSFTDEYLNKVPYDPREYDVNFFLWNIARTSLVNTVFGFPNSTYDSNLNAWVTKDGISYSISPESVVLSSSSETAYTFKMTVIKRYSNIENRYEQSVNISKSSFATSEKSKSNFVSKAAKTINELISTNKINIISSKPEAFSISDFTSPSDVDIKTSGQSSLASSFFKQLETNKYITNNSDFQYISDGQSSSFVNFSIPVSGKIFSSDQYVLDNNGLISENSEIYKTLKSEYDSNNLTYLPTLTQEEMNSISSIANQQDAILKRRIQKLIFDPVTYNVGFNVNNQGYKIPLGNLQAVLVKVELGNTYTWVVAWSNLLTPTEDSVLNAPELRMRAVNKGDKTLLWSDLLLESNYKFIQTITPVSSKDLTYKVKRVSFDESDTAKKSAKVLVEVSHKEINTTKEYETIVTEGFYSKSYNDLLTNVSSITSGLTNFTNVVPAQVTKKQDVADRDVINNINNVNWLSENITFTKPAAITVDVVYTVVRASYDGEWISFTLLISPADDPTNFLKVNSINQEIFAHGIKVTQTSSNKVFLKS